MKNVLMALMCVLCALAFAPAARGEQPTEKFWTRLAEVSEKDKAAEPWVRPARFQAAMLDEAAMVRTLATAPMEFTADGDLRPLTLSLPMPDGTMQDFAIVESPIMAPELAAQFPEIKTYRGQGLHDLHATIRLDHTPQGFHAQVRSPRGDVYIDPYSRANTTLYSIYYKRDNLKADQWLCDTVGSDALGLPALNIELPQAGYGPRNASPLKTYRLACAATGEYTAFHGGTVALGQAAIVTAINRVTGVYETELCIRMVLVANNSNLVYTNSSTDPYTNGNGSTMLTQNQNTCTSVIGSANYDIGHVFSTGGGGIAGLGVVCNTSNKARGVTGNTAPTGDSFWIDYVAHEMGHQFGGNHPFNGTGGSCAGGNRNDSTAYEPGSGNTIMAYAGICSADDLQPHSDAYFGFIGQQEITAYTSGSAGGSACPTSTATGNTAPTANAGTDFTIPFGTPFTLTGSGADVNSDPLTYCWEERDLNSGSTGAALSAGDTGTGPIIRSFSPTTSPAHTVPRLSNLLANTFAIGEILPDSARTLNFRLTTRDNRAAAGGFGTDDMIVTVASSGPFLVTSPNTAVSWASGSTQTITWNVAGTSAAPVNTANVKISLSTDGGNTFPTVLLASTPNDGTQTITIPSPATTTARIKVEAVGNIYFDISNTNFTITGCTAPTVTANPSPVAACPGGGASFTAVGTGAPNFQWRKNLANIGGATSSTYSIAIVGAGDVGSYDCVMTNGCGTATSTGAALTIGAAPSISSQPTSQTACTGSSVTFTVVASGTPAPTYQWKKGAATLSGQTSPSLTIDPVSLGSPANYTCIVTNSCGEVTSDIASLAIQTPPTIFTHPSPQTTCAGSGFSFSVAAGGSPAPTFQWRRDTTNVPGATSATYSVAAADAGMAGTYDCVITNLCNTLTSNTASLTVNTPPGFSTQPSPQQVCAGQPFSFNAVATGSPTPTLQWRLNGADIPGATGTSYGGTASTHGTYDCIATNSCAATPSTPAALTINTGPSITSDPSSQSACLGGSATFSVGISGSPAPTYQWRKGGSAIVGATSGSLTINPIIPGDAGSYDCLVTNPCGSIPSEAASLTINTSPIITSDPSPQSACLGGSATFTAGASGFPAPTFQWRKGGTDLPGHTGPTLLLTSLTGADAGDYDCVATNACGSATTSAASLSIGVAPAITSSPAPVTVSENGAAMFSVAASGTGPFTYQWRKGGSNLSNAGNISGALTDTLTISPVAAGDADNYDCIVGNACGNATCDEALLTVTPAGCGTSDFDGDGDFGTDADIQAFFACLGGNCCATCGSPDFNGDGDFGTDADIEAFFRVLGGGTC